ncbi:MAG: hypothetical protein ACREEP_20005 [Dongiaceae bacterium]
MRRQIIDAAQMFADRSREPGRHGLVQGGIDRAGALRQMRALVESLLKST